MEIDCKFVPKECYNGDTNCYPKSTRAYHYQYTIIDESSRERFLYPYENHTADSTVDFIKRAIVQFGYVPKCIQTDNGVIHF
ncbi:MAG: DDE-type integrase/transposase/recombinase [Firmicutes bacterium]|nr:DDE-type integrase/transposase/recombinase [Bacillota bacterium]MCL1953948.1 DDE-type integrase/transposase/recombinase [Bacillota bacterium]